MIKIAVDAMGGDNAPVEIIKGAVESIKEQNAHILLVGQQQVIETELKKYHYPEEKIEIVPATEVISTEESPTNAIRRKKDSSMVVGLNLVKQKKQMLLFPQVVQELY